MIALLKKVKDSCGPCAACCFVPSLTRKACALVMCVLLALTPFSPRAVALAKETSPSDVTVQTSESTSLGLTDSKEDSQQDVLASSLIELAHTAETASENNAAIVDLNAAWAAQESGTAVSFTISAGGMYALTADLSVAGVLIIDAPGQDVVLDLASYVLTSSVATPYSGIQVKAAGSVTITGAYDRLGKAQLVQRGESPGYLIESKAGALSLTNVGTYQRSDETSVTMATLSTIAVRVTAGTLEMRDCSVVVDQSNQTKPAGSTGGETKGWPAGIYVGQNVEAAQIINCNVSVVGSPALEMPSGKSWTASAYYNAYGLYVYRPKGQVAVRGGSLSVTSAKGYATGAIADKNLRLETSSTGKAVEITVEAGRVAAGVRSRSASAVTLAGALDVGFTGRASVVNTGLLAYDSGTSASYENGFGFEEGFSATNLGVVVGDPESSSNEEGYIIGTVASSAAQKGAAIADSLVNAFDASASTQPSYDADTGTVVFAFDETNAPVEVVSDGKVARYGSVDEALGNMKSGSTLRLLQDSSSIHFNIGAENETYMLDLNGHASKSVVLASDADISLVSTTSRSVVKGVNDSGAAIEYTGNGSLGISNIEVVARSVTHSVSAVLSSGSGTLAMDNVIVRASSNYGSVNALRVSGAAELRNSQLYADSSAANVPVRAVYGETSDALVMASTTGCAEAASGLSSAVDVNGSLRASDGCVFTASVASKEASAWAVRARGANTTAELSNVSVAAKGPEGASLWSLASGESGVSAAVQWRLAGACTFGESAALAGVFQHPIELSFDFSVAGSPVQVCASGLTAHTCFTGAEGADISSKAAYFSAADTSVYNTWELVPSDNGKSLVWHHSPVVKNATTDATYGSFKDAFDAANAGDTLVLTADAVAVGAMSVDKSITFDLAGHTLSWTMDVAEFAKTDDTLVGLCLAGGVRFTVKDSSDAKGALSFQITNSSSVLDSSTYACINVPSVSSLALDGVSLQCEYTARGSAPFDASFIGVSGGGSVSLTRGADVSVTASGTDAKGIEKCAAVQLLGARASVSVDEDCSVRATNNSSTEQRGSLVTSVDWRKYDMYLLEFFPEKASDVYKEIQKKFRSTASVDTELETSTYYLGTNVYYAAPLELDDGTLVWAYSDPVDANDIGDASKIVATHFYCQAYAEIPADAYALELSGNGARAGVKGSLSAASAQGNAYALRVQDSAQASVESSASLAADAGKTAYRALGAQFDLREELNLDKAQFTQFVYYPSTSEGHHLTLANPKARCVSTAGGAATLAEGVAQTQFESSNEPSKLTEPLSDEAQGNVRVRFTNLRGASGTCEQDVECTLVFGQTLSSAGAAVPNTSDFTTASGVTYRFVGWSVALNYGGSYVWSNKSFAADCAFDSSVTGASSGEVDVVASYVPVDSGQSVITFSVDSFLKCYAADAGQVPNYLEAAAGAQSSTPGKITSEEGKSFNFNCWRASDGTTYTGLLPEVSGDAVYEASFTSTPDTVTTTFNYYVVTDESSEYKTVFSTANYGGSAGASIANVTSRFTLQQVVYELQGWSTRKTDKTALYASLDALPQARAAEEYYAIYTTHDQLVSVRFYVDGVLYAEALDVPATATIDTALFDYAKASKPADKDAEHYFRGWATEEGSSVRVTASSLGELTNSEGVINLYAVYASGGSEDDPENPSDGTDDKKKTENGDDDGDTPDYVPQTRNDGQRGSRVVASGGSSTGSTTNRSNSGTSSQSSRNTGSKLAAQSVSTATPEAALDAGDDALETTALNELTEADFATEDEAADENAEEGSEAANFAGFFAVVGLLLAAAAAISWGAIKNRRDDRQSEKADDITDADTESMDF